jgi:hypothetical protein
LTLRIDDGIVVVVGSERLVSMDVEVVPASLRGRLGAEATAGLVECLDRARREWKGEVVTLAVERFERRLTEEVSGLREETRNGDAGLRAEMHAGHAGLREEMRNGDAALREEMRNGDAALRAEMRNGDAALRAEMHSGFAELRSEMREGDVALRAEMHSGFAKLRSEMCEGDAALRVEMHQSLAALRVEMHGLTGGVRQEIATTRGELIRWSFVFWAGQTIATAGLVVALVKLLP